MAPLRAEFREIGGILIGGILSPTVSLETVPPLPKPNLSEGKKFFDFVGGGGGEFIKESSMS